MENEQTDPASHPQQPAAPVTPRAGSGKAALSPHPSTPLTRSEAEAHWRIHANEILASDTDYLATERIQKHVGKVVGWSYVVLVTSLLAFMMGFYLWRFRFFWAICVYVVLLCLAALAARTISVPAMRNDHLGDRVKAAHDRFINQATGSIVP